MSSRPKRMDGSAATPLPDLSQEEDADLLTYMAMREDCPDYAREAWAELFRRHSRYLFAVCQRTLENLPRSPGTAEDLTHDVFMRVFERAGTYCQPAGLSVDEKRRWLRAWLGQIAKNLIRDFFRGQPPEGGERLLDRERWDEVPASEPGSGEISSERLAVVNDLMDKVLEERERQVLRITFQYYVPDRKNQRLPNHVVEELSAELKTTSENLRKIRQRAIERLKKALKQQLGPLPVEG